MSKTIEILDAIDDAANHQACFTIQRLTKELRALLAAPVVERQPVACVIAFREGVKEPEVLSWNQLPVGEHMLYAEQPAPVSLLANGFTTLETGNGKYKIVTEFPSRDDAWAAYTALVSGDKPAPVAVVKPVAWRIPVNGAWFYGTKEQCEREYAEYTADFTSEDFDEDGPAKPEPLACLDKVKELNQ